jgi:predicted ATPase
VARLRLAAASDGELQSVDRLAPIADPARLADAIAAALGLGSGIQTAEAAIIALLRMRRPLLILDNAE